MTLAGTEYAWFLSKNKIKFMHGWVKIGKISGVGEVFFCIFFCHDQCILIDRVIF
jgi:hypothetical protein